MSKPSAGARRVTRSGRAGIALVLAFCFAGALPAAGPSVGTKTFEKPDYGLATAKRANCLGCHKWHGSGGPGYGGAAISLRDTSLGRDDLIRVIRCGRPGTNMPYFDRRAYQDDSCYGVTLEDYDADDPDRPLRGKKLLNERQIDAIADFIIAELKGKPLTRAYCEKVFGGPTKQCESIPPG